MNASLNPMPAIRDLFRSRAEKRSSSSFGAGAIPSAPILSGTYITPQTALGLTAVYAGINVISKDIAALPRRVCEILPDGSEIPAPNHYLNYLLSVSPDDEIDSFRWVRDDQAHVLGWGNGHSEVVRNGRGEVQSIHILDPAKTKAKRTDSGRLYYELLDSKRKLSSDNVLHMAGLGFNGLEGYSPITIARQSIGLSMGAEQFGASFFGNGAVGKGVIKLAKRIGEAAVNNLRKSFGQVHQGSSNAHNVIILEEGMDYVQTQIPPNDAQFLETRRFTVEEIARLLGLPPHKIGDYSNAHMANVEESNLDYIATTIAGWVAMRESQYNWKLLSKEERRRYVIRHDMSSLMMGNSVARAQYYQIMRNLGVMSADDICRREGMLPIGKDNGGNLYVIQSQYVQLIHAGLAMNAGTAVRPPAQLQGDS